MVSSQPGDFSAVPADVRARLHGWRHPAVLSVVGLAVAAGFAQFGPTAALGEVAAEFGQTSDGQSLAAQVGLPVATLGLGLSVIRLASLGSLPLAAAADTFGRRRVILVAVSAGLALTAAASLSPGFWWFVAIIAASRPALAATSAVGGVIVAEATGTADRAKAIALLAVGYGTGAALAVLARFAGGDALTFRKLFLLATVPLLAVPLLGRLLEEPARFTATLSAERLSRRLLGRLGGEARRRLGLLAALTFAVAFLTAPVNAYLFVYGENVLKVTRATTATLVPVAAVLGALGLLAGRWAADVLGRRPTAALAQVGLALAGAATYSGSTNALFGGYVVVMFVGSVYTPAFGALSAELFATRVRATAAGWLTVAGVLGGVAGLLTFGVLAGALDGFAAAAAALALPVAGAALLFAGLPETRALELEESATDDPG